MTFGEVSESKDLSENTKEGKDAFDPIALQKFDSLMEDDEIPESNDVDVEDMFEDGDELFDKMFADDVDVGTNEADKDLNEIGSRDTYDNSNLQDDDIVADAINTNDVPEKAEESLEHNGDDINESSEEEKQEICDKTGWSKDTVDMMKSKEEAEIYMNAGLKEQEIDGKKCLVRSDIDMEQKDEFGQTNKERMENGNPPLTKDGETVELHHIGQKPDSPLAELTMQEHRGKGNDNILHEKQKESEIDRNEFAKERKLHWESRSENL